MVKVHAEGQVNRNTDEDTVHAEGQVDRNTAKEQADSNNGEGIYRRTGRQKSRRRYTHKNRKTGIMVKIHAERQVNRNTGKIHTGQLDRNTSEDKRRRIVDRNTGKDTRRRK